MGLRFADRLSTARLQHFVGRSKELQLFQSLISTPALPFCVLHIYGPGGIGKTLLMFQFAAQCRQQDLPVWYVDGQTIEPQPEAFLHALQEAMRLSPTDNPLQILASAERRHVLLIDAYDHMSLLDRWIREHFLPQLTEHVLVILAGRQPLDTAWYADPGWQRLLSSLRLGSLSLQEEYSYLRNYALAHEQQQRILSFTYGYPLALSLISSWAARQPHTIFQPEMVPDIIKALFDRVGLSLRDTQHQLLLEICALARRTTEPLLTEFFADTEVRDLFNWLRHHSFIEVDIEGLAPHDLVREVVTAEMRWRNRRHYAELRQRLRSFYTLHLQQSRGSERQRYLNDYIFLHQMHPIARSFYPGHRGAAQHIEPASEADWPILISAIEQHEGPEAAQIAAHWFARQPGQVLVVRAAAEDNASVATKPIGFLAVIELQLATADDLAMDPATQTIWRYIQQHAPLHAHERALFFRFWMSCEHYQHHAPVHEALWSLMLHTYLATPNLAFSAFPCADPEFWAPLCAYTNMDRIPDADFAIDGHSYGIYGHDWRVIPHDIWLDWLIEQELSSPEPQTLPLSITPLISLGWEAFLRAVRHGLHTILQPAGLISNPLLRSRMVINRTGNRASPIERVPVLQALIQEACAILRESPREARAYRAIQRTYLQPVDSQEQAAEMLGLPFGTFRRHLKIGVVRVAEILWQWETQGKPAERELSVALS